MDREKKEATQVATTGKEEATQVATTGKEEATQFATTGKEEAAQFAATGKEEATQVATTGKEEATQVATTGKEEATQVATTNNERVSHKKTIGSRAAWRVALVAFVVLAAVLGGGWLARRFFASLRMTGGVGAQATAPSGEQTVVAFVGELASATSASGQLLPRREAQLALEIAGRVERVDVQVGDRVRQGDVLVQVESQELQRAVESAQQSLAIQEASLSDLLRGADAQDLIAAEAAVTSAQARLDDLLAGPSEEERAQAEAALASAQTRLDDLLAGPSAEDLAQARAALTSTQAALQMAKARYEALDDQLVVAQNDIHNAQLAIDRARDQYNLLVWNDWKAGVSWAPYSPQGKALKKAQINYQVAVANYNLTKGNVNDSTVRSAEAQVAQAEAALAALTGEKTVQIAAARAQVARARANLAALGEKTVQIAAARAQLAQAKANLARLCDGASDEQVVIVRAQVEQARIALAEAQENLANAALVAPFDGTVAAVHVVGGEWASGLAVELVDMASLEVVLDVDEIDIGQIEVGQPAVITLEAWPARELSGRVVAVAPKARNIGGIVTYQVRLALDTENLPVRSGMTADARLIASRRANALLVPNRAITADRQEGKYYVERLEGGEARQVEVTIGLRDDAYTEILNGLQEGDQLVIKEAEQEIDFRMGPPSGVREFR